MLRYRADLRTLAYMLVMTLLFAYQWAYGWQNAGVYVLYLFFSVAVSVIAHNHNHIPIWTSKLLNRATDYWLTVFYGFPVFAWIPTHNRNHHKFNNREGDYTITYRISEENNFLTLLTYPSISAYFQQAPISIYLRSQWTNSRVRFWECISEYGVLILWIGAFLFLDWYKAIWLVILPQQFATFSVLVFNYVQHVHADEESEIDHSRNFKGMINILLFNNGLHTAHHLNASLHWSLIPDAHRELEPRINPDLIEPSMFYYLFRNYTVGLFFPRFRTKSMRLERLAHHTQTAAA